MQVFKTLIYVALVSSLTEFSSANNSPITKAREMANLVTVYSLASQHDAQLSAARHDYLAQREAIPQSRAGLLPKISATAGTSLTKLSRDTPALSRQRSSETFGANLSQPVYQLELWYGLKTAKASVSEAEFSLLAKEQELVYRAAEVYFSVLRAADTVATTKAEEEALLKQRDQAKGMLDDGMATITDVLDAQAAYDVSIANRLLAEGKLSDAYDALAKLTGKTYESVIGIDHEMPVEAPIPNNVSDWIPTGLAQNPEIQANHYRIEKSENLLKQQKAGYAPTVAIVASYKKGDNDGFGYSNPADFSGNSTYRGDIAQSSIGLELNIPLYSGGSTTSKVREAMERLYESQDQYSEKQREIVRLIKGAHRAINLDVQQYKARRQSVYSAVKAVDANKIGLEVGTRNTSDVLLAQKQLFDSIREYNKSRYDYILDTLKLKQLLGVISPADLSALARWMSSEYNSDRGFLPEIIKVKN